MSDTQPKTTHLAPELLAAASALGTATLHEASGKLGALPGAIKPMAPGFRVCGPAYTVHGPAVDNLWLHRAIAAAAPGDVLIACVSGHFEAGYWGEIMSTAAQVRKLGGLVIDGCVRDGHLLPGIGFPVFARGLNIYGTGKDFGARGWLGAPVLIGDVVVETGDLVVGDQDGVVTVRRSSIKQVLQAAREREAAEAAVIQRILAGETTVGIFGWPAS
jgi:4-hydroxy-4-methyl-2-oxoglutarate aldolase